MVLSISFWNYHLPYEVKVRSKLMILSKLGPHVLLPSDHALRWSVVAPIVKAWNTFEALLASPAWATRVYRKQFDDQDLSRNGGDVAREILNALGGFKPEYVELYNERGQYLGQGPQGLERHVDFTREAVEVLHPAGIKVAGFSFSTSNPQRDAWLYLRDHGFGGADAVSLHEYWGNGQLEQDKVNRDGCGLVSGVFSTCHALRHRLLHDWVGGDHPPFIITECGRDWVEGGPAGWKLANICPQTYLDELKAYDQELAQDTYVIGGTVFTAGADFQWRNFQMDDLVPAILGTGPVPPCGGRISPWLVVGITAVAAAAGLVAVSVMEEE